MRRRRYKAAAAGLIFQACFLAFPAFPQSQAAYGTAGPADLEAAINAGDPAAAREFLSHAAAAPGDPEKAAGLTAKALALKDLSELIERRWRDEQEAELSRALALRIDLNTPLTLMGLGPAPEPLLPWMGKYIHNNTQHKKELVARAIRQWAATFGNDGPANKDDWNKATIRERNVFLAYNAADMLTRLVNRDTRTSAEFQAQVRAEPMLKYLDEQGRGRYQRYLTQLAAAEAAKARLEPDKLEGIKDQPIEQQMYLLAEKFDNSRQRGDISAERKLDALRQSRPAETISYQENRLLADKLRAALPRELRGTEAGGEALKFYRSGAKLSLAIESCRNCYAKYEPSTGRIVLDSEMIQQYMRVNNLTTAMVLENAAVLSALAKYVSPMFVHESAHQALHAAADRAGVYRPYTQEDEIAAAGLEARYTGEKMRTDMNFRAVFLNMERNSVYARKRIEVMERYRGGPSKFDRMIRQVYYYELPSAEAAEARILAAVSAELERRKSLPAAELAEIENGGIGRTEAMKMTMQELLAAAGEIKTPALKKIRADMLASVAARRGGDKAAV